MVPPRAFFMRGFAPLSLTPVLWALAEERFSQKNLIVPSLLLSIPTEHLDYTNCSK